MIDSINNQNLGGKIYDWTHPISETIGLHPDPQLKTVKYVAPADPLILDLDGDGIEITPLSKGILFDGDANTIKTNTAWVGADDGMLVYDRDGNGTIDSGRELFGDETILSDGAKASDGFAALRDLDTGKLINGQTIGANDHVFDANDALYNTLRIWRDLNQDGISQANELKTLTESGVKSIDLNSLPSASTASSGLYQDAQRIQASYYSHSDGTLSQIGSFTLAQNNFLRSFNPVTVSDAAKALPNIQGSGWVRDLQEAASLNPDLVTLFNNAKNATIRAEFKDDVASLLREWASGGSSSYNSAGKVALSNGYGLIMSEPQNDQERAWIDKAVKAGEVDRNAFRATLSAADLASFDAMRERMVGSLEKLFTYEAFTGYTFLDWTRVWFDALAGRPNIVNSGIPIEVSSSFSQIIADAPDLASMSSQAGYIIVRIPVPLTGMAHIDSLWNRIVDDASNNLMPSLRLASYLDQISLSITDSGVSLNFEQMDASLATGISSNAYEGAALFLDMYNSMGKSLIGLGWSGLQQLQSLMESGLTSSAIRNAFTITGFNFLGDGTALGYVSNDVMVGNANNNLFEGRGGNDLLAGLAGDDNLNGGEGDDVLIGGDGNDTITGGIGNDIYLFGRGDDQDRINSDYDTAANKLNILAFKTGISANAVGVTRSGPELILSVIGTSDKVTIYGYFNGDDPSNLTNPIQLVTFTDGITWDINKLKAIAISGDDTAQILRGYVDQDTINALGGNDTVYGQAGNDTLNGGAGADDVYGGDGDDMLYGGADNDFLYGGNGTDTLDGGTGNDTLSGEAENDTYLFGKGDGQDNIRQDNDASTTKLNVLQFKAGVSPSEVLLNRSGSSLILSITGTTDKMDINSFFYNSDPANNYNPIQQFKFANGTSWDLSTLKSMLIAGNDTAQTLMGFNTADTINAMGGNDTVESLAGDDTIDGGTGNDQLYGNAGNDTYLFGKGDGQDTIQPDYDTATTKLNVLQFKAGVAPSELIVTRLASELVLSIAGTADQVTMNLFFSSDNPSNAYNPIQKVKFADGTSWDITTIKTKAITGNAAAQTLTGYTGDDTIYALGGNDMVYGQAGNDTLDGGTGIDTIQGGDGNDSLFGGADNDFVYGGVGVDTLDGGTGNDQLYGNAGNDTYLFGKGEGQDTIQYDYDLATTKLNVLQFKSGVAPSELIVTRSGSDLVLSIAGTTDKVTMSMFFSSDNPGNAYNPIQQVKFADGTNWDASAIKNKLFAGTLATDNISGTLADDVINGQAGADYLYGCDGNDTLNGGAENDSLYGEQGNDILSGGAGKDLLIGGVGADKFVLSTLFDSGVGTTLRDIIQDFSATQGDKIDVHTLDANSTVTGNQQWTFSASGFSGVAGQISFDATNHLVQFDQNGDKGADMVIELVGVNSISANDFIFV